MFITTRTIALGLVFATASVAGAQATARLAVTPASKIWIEGTSNVHDWKCESSAIDAAIDVDVVAGSLTAGLPKSLKQAAVKLPAKTLKCGHGKMDDNMYKALKADQNADITYTMASFETVPGEAKDEFTLRIVGALTIAGVEKSVTVDAAATRLADGTIKAVGTVPVKMTAFGIKPPTAMFGTIKCGDDVKVKFELSVGAKVVAALTEK